MIYLGLVVEQRGKLERSWEIHQCCAQRQRSFYMYCNNDSMYIKYIGFYNSRENLVGITILCSRINGVMR